VTPLAFSFDDPKVMRSRKNIMLELHPLDACAVLEKIYNEKNRSNFYADDKTEISCQKEALEAISWQQSHEVRRPVANILGLINLIEDEENKTGYNPIYLEYLKTSAQELDNIIHKIVNITLKD
jgi:signal transduction histidine kinase